MASLPENSWPFLKWDSLPLRALVIRSQPVSVSLSSPPLTLLLSSYETFPPSEGIVFQIFLPWRGFCFGPSFQKLLAWRAPSVHQPAGMLDAATRRPILRLAYQFLSWAVDLPA